MRVLIVSRYVCPPSFHGSAQHAQLFAKELVNAGHQVRVATGECESGSREVEGVRYDKFELGPLPRGIPRIFDGRLPSLKLRIWAKSYLKEFEPDVVHVGVFMRMSEFVLAAKDMDIPVVMMNHDYSLLCLRKFFEKSDGQCCTYSEYTKCLSCVGNDLGPKARLVNVAASLPVISNLIGSQAVKYSLPVAVRESFGYLSLLGESVDCFVTQNFHSTRILTENGIPSEKCCVVNQFIGDDKLFRYPKENARPGSARPIRFGYVGRWSKEKGLEVLRSALHQLGTLEYECWLIAKGTRESDFEQLFGELARDGKVRLFGNLTGADLAKQIALLDVLIIPSVCQELGPRTFWEGIAQGVPAIVSDSVGHRSFIKAGSNGEVFPSRDDVALSQKLRQLIEHPEKVASWQQSLPRPSTRVEWSTKIIDLHSQLVD